MIWFLSQVGKAIDCNSMTVGSNPTGTSIPEIGIQVDFLEFAFFQVYIIVAKRANSSTG